jgi:putative ABC transport system permease protein
MQPRRSPASALLDVEQDVRYAVRGLARAPGLAATIVVTLALAIGANAALFSLLDRLFLRAPAGVEQPDRLRRMYVRSVQAGLPTIRDLFEYREYLQLDTVLSGSARLVAFTAPDSVRTGSVDASRVRRAVYTTANYFDVLGVRPRVGRFFSDDEARMGDAAPVVVISDALWRDEFAADGATIGRTLSIEDDRYTVIGVTPPGFAGVDLDAAELWLPLGRFAHPPLGGEPWYRRWRSARLLRLLARVSPVTSVPSIAARATIVRRRGGAGENRVDTTATVLTGPLIETLGPSTSPRLEVAIASRLGAVVLIVLLIACANVANLLLARGVQRRREIAVRLALGMSRRRLVAQLLTESLFLGVAGGVAGVLLGALGGATLRATLLPQIHWSGPPFDARVALFSGAVALTAGLLAGLAPALQASRPDLTSALKAGAREGTFQRSRLRTGLIVVQAALSVVLLAGAGFFVESLHNVRAIDLGYDAERLVFASVEYRNPECRCVDRYFGDATAIATGLARAKAALSPEPAVEHVALGSSGPMYGYALTRTYRSNGDTIPKLDGNGAAIVNVSPDYFATTGMRLLRGRFLSSADRAGAPPVMVVNETMARTVWPGQNPLGSCLILGAPAPMGQCYAVVGIVSDGHRGDIVETPMMQYYIPLEQDINRGPARPRVLIVRAAPGRVALVAAQTRRVLRSIFPTAEPPRVTSLTERLAPQFRPWRLGALLFSSFGALALVVATLGIYSVVGFAVRQRRHELGIRRALGAGAGTLMGLVIGEGVRSVAVGIGAGLLLTLAMGRAVESLLYGTSTRNPVVLLVVTVLLLAAAALASAVPGCWATRVDPAEVLRAD